MHLQLGIHQGLLAGTKGRGILHGSLAEERPDLALQWVPESNGSQTPHSVSVASDFKAAWRCGRGCEHCGTPHEWTAKVAQRTLHGRGCPLCSGLNICRCRSVAAMHPELMKQWDWEGNQDIDPHSIGCHSHIKVFWTCIEHGQWGAAVHDRVRSGTGCPECARQRKLGARPQQRASTKEELPEIYAELHPTKNAGVDTKKLTCGSNKKVWWLCQSNHSRPEGCQHVHEWETQVQKRCRSRRPTGCPFCNGRRVCPCKSLAKLQPTLLQSWDFAANTIPLQEPLDPSRIGQQSARKAWWRHKCVDGQEHHWTASISNVVSTFVAKDRVPCPKCGAALRAGPYAERRRRLIEHL